jgi:hypothetical protein
LSEAERADTQAFLREILQILPLIGLNCFEEPKTVAAPMVKSDVSSLPIESDKEPDTIIVPAKQAGFTKVFLGENAWYAIRISAGKIPKIKYIAAYQAQPISAITHVAPVAKIEPYGDKGKIPSCIFRTRQADWSDSIWRRAVRLYAGDAIYDIPKTAKG